LWSVTNERGARLFAPDEKLCGAAQGQIGASNERVAPRFCAQEEPRPCRPYKRSFRRKRRSRGNIDAPRKLLANDGFESRQRQGVTHRPRIGKEGMAVRRQAWIMMCEKVRQHDAKNSVSGETVADVAQESHRIGDEIDRVRDMDDPISHTQIHFLDLAIPHVNTHFSVHVRNRGVDVDSFGVPAVPSKCLHGFAEATGDIEEASSVPGEWGKDLKRARRNRTAGGAADLPNTLQFGDREARRALVLQPNSLQDAQTRLMRRIGVGAAAAQLPFIRGLVALLMPPALDFRIERERSGPVVNAVANWAKHRSILAQAEAAVAFRWIQ
jgi:hypothetical protein